MPITPFVRLIRLISDGEPINADVANRSPIDIAKRTQHLKELIDALQASQLLQIPDATIEEGVEEGTPVFLDISTNTYRPAIAASASQEAGNPALPQAYVSGLVVDLETPTRGTIGTFGRFVGFALTDWAGVVAPGDVTAGEAIPGHYYLSATQAGVMSRQPAGLGVYVGELSATGVFYIRAGVPDYAAHTHHNFVLSPLPAVADISNDISQGGGGEWTIDTPDADEPGWLPADPTAGFTQAEWLPPGINPADSFFYNLDHPSEAALRAIFPPVPVDSYVFIQDGLVQPKGRVIVNSFGIWWTENTNAGIDAAPWSENVQANPSDEAPVEFWFSRILLATDDALVRSLQIADDSPMAGEIIGGGGQPAKAGDLLLRLLGIDFAAGLDESATAVKSITGGSGTTGPVVNRVRPGPGIGVSGTHGGPTSGFYGNLTFSLVNTLLTQGVAASADLNNAREESIQGVRAVSLVAGRTASPTWTVHVSPAVAASSDMRLRFWVHISAGGGLPSSDPLTLEYKIVPRSQNPASIPGFTALSPFTPATTGLNQPLTGLYQVTDPLVIPSVPAGSTVLVRLNRSSSDPLTGNVNILRVEFELV